MKFLKNNLLCFLIILSLSFCSSVENQTENYYHTNYIYNFIITNNYNNLNSNTQLYYTNYYILYTTNGNVIYYTEIYSSIIYTNTINQISIITTTNIIYNYFEQTNKIQNYFIQGDILITNLNNHDTVQPTFKINGSIDNELVNLVKNLRIIVSNTGFTNIANVYNNYWESIILTQYSTNYINVILEAELSNGYFICMKNFFVSNIPSYELSLNYNNIITNANSIEISGNAYVTEPDEIENVIIYKSNENNIVNSFDCDISASIPGWTNTISMKYWIKEISLDYGNNYFYGYIISKTGIPKSIDPFIITKALIGVDGIKDTIWDYAPIVGISENPGYSNFHINELRITNDNFNIYFWINIVNVPNTGSVGPRISIAIDTNSTDGYEYDAWDGLFKFIPINNNKPDFQIQFRVANMNEINGAAIYSSTGTNWNLIAYTWSGGFLQGSKFGVNLNYGFEISVPKSLLGLTSGSKLNTVVILSGPNGGKPDQNRFVWDVIPENVSNEYHTFDNENSTNYLKIQVYNNTYIVQ